jgi:hypothetical protein
VISQLSGHTILVFVGIPALVVAVVALLVFAPSIASGPRYRPGLSWWAPPVWIGGPSSRPATTDAPELTAGDPAGDAADDTPATASTGVARTTGGASASW